MCIINDWLGLVNLRSHGSINTYTNIQKGRNSFRLHSLSFLSQSGIGRLLPNPLNLNIKIEILICYLYTFSIEVVGRIC